MTPRLSGYPPLPSSHPVVARCQSEMEAAQVEAVLRSAGIACIRMDREAASAHEGRVLREAALILVSRTDFARANELLASVTSLPDRSTAAEPA